MGERERKLKDFIKANKERKLKLAERAGFDSVYEYKMVLKNSLKDLEGSEGIPIAEAYDRYKVNNVVKSMATGFHLTMPTHNIKFDISYGGSIYEINTNIVVYYQGKWAENLSLKPTIYIIQAVDSSGSMFNYGEKYKFHAAVQGFTQEIEELKQNTDANFMLTVLEFSESSYLHVNKENIQEVENIRWREFKERTRLNDTILFVVDYVKKLHTEDKILIKFFTDGQDVGSHASITQVRKAIKILPENITFAFAASEEDKRAISKYNIEESNLLYYKNTVDGVADTFKMSARATMNYTTRTLAGEDVSKGFYKNLK